MFSSFDPASARGIESGCSGYELVAQIKLAFRISTLWADSAGRTYDQTTKRCSCGKIWTLRLISGFTLRALKPSRKTKTSKFKLSDYRRFFRPRASQRRISCVDFGYSICSVASMWP
jgi:hypothetical protein